MELFPVGKIISPDFKVIPITENVSLVSTDGQTEINTSGIFSIQVICGVFEILGYKLTPASLPVEVHSTKEFSLKVSPISSQCKSNTELNEGYLKSLGFSDIIIINILKSFETAEYLILVSVDDRLTQFGNYLESYLECPVYSKKLLEKSVISYDGNHNVPKSNSIRIHKEWLGFGSTLTKGRKKVIIAGGRNVGKSTLMKYLINKSLANCREVLILDFDPGQAEFSVMGCVSAVVVSKPALGPNFSHLVTPIKSFYLGSISVVNCSQQYEDYVGKIIELCSSTSAFRDIPWFINTMGFTKGLGIKLIQNIILRVQPTDVIQINSEKKLDNFPDNLNKEFISNDRVIRQSLKYSLHVIPSVAKNKLEMFDPTTSGTSPARKRDMVLLSYFYQMLNPQKPIFTECVPYKFSLNKKHIVITANDTLVKLNKIGRMITLNGTLIGLCYQKGLKFKEDSSYEDLKFVEFRGFGIVRGVSFQDEEIYINTPLNEEELRQINVIYMTSTIQLPDSVYKLRNGNVEGKIPYMAQTYPSHLNQMIRKSTSRIRPYDRKPTGGF